MPNNGHCCYILLLDQDLFGAFILYRQWWGLLNRRGGTKRQVFFDSYVSVDWRSTDSP
jgi:hypothetical protein